ncbi:MAG: hypothetical protein ACI841_003362 [Planctomycetota bacterium]|jgi:hypothetical protein
MPKVANQHRSDLDKKPQTQGIEITARRSLPDGWRFDQDLLVLFGEDEGQVEQQRDAGQRRIIHFDPSAKRAHDFDNGVAVVSKQTELMQVVQLITGEAPTRVNLWVMFGAEPPLELQREISATLAKAVKAWLVNRNTMESFGELWLRQLVANMWRVAVHPTVQELDGIFEDRPCLIVSPGPSLEKNIDQVPAFVGKAVIVTCAHALHALESVGVVPDIVVVGDARELRWQYADYDFSRVKAIVQMAGGSEAIFDLPAQRVFTYGFSQEVDLWLYSILGKQGFLASGGSVACVELSLALRMGCPEVIYIGQDLAFDGERYYTGTVRDGGSKARVSDDGKSMILERYLPVDEHNHKNKPITRADPQNILQVRGYNGGKVETSYCLSVFRDWFTLVVDSDICSARVFNCTEGGAYIDGMLHLPLQQVLRRMRESTGPPIATALDQCIEGWDSEQARERMLKFMQTMSKDLARCQWLSQQCLQVIKKARKRPAELDKLQRHEAELQHLLDDLPFASMVATREIEKAADLGQTATTMEQSLDAAQRLYAVVLRAMQMMQDPLGESLRRLNAA